MRLALIVLALMACKSSSPSSSPPPPPAPGDARIDVVDVHVDRRVELMSILHRLAGGREYRTAPNTAYVADVDKHFTPFAEHAAVVITRNLRERPGIVYDAPMFLAVHLDEQLKLRAPVAEPLNRFATVDVEKYLAAIREFVTASSFDAFFAKHRGYHDKVVAHWRTAIAKENPTTWFDTFFGARPGARFIVIPGLLTGSRFYGPHVGDELYQIMGVERPDFDDLPTIDDATIELLVHEMAHAYINPLFAKHRAALEPHGKRLLALVKDAMRNQAYPMWDVMLNESGVRAVTTLYLRDRKGAAAGDAAIKREVARSFRWTPELAALLATYVSQRARYPKLDAFMPEVVTLFSTWQPSAPVVP